MNPLINKTIHIKPIKRKGSWISQLTSNDNHDGSFMYSGARLRLRGVPYDIRLRRRVDILSKEEQDFFESPASGLNLKPGDLSIYTEGKNNYWDKFEIVLEKNGIILNLADPMDFIRLKFLLAQKELIAPSWEERFDKGTYKYAVVDEEVEVKERVSKRNKLNNANRLFGKIEDSPEKMIDFLNIYNGGKKIVSDDSKREFLVSEIDKIIESDVEGFMKVIEDDNYETKAFINRCIRKTLIIKEKGNKYSIQGEEDSFTMTELVEFLNDKGNQLVYGRLKAQVE